MKHLFLVLIMAALVLASCHRQEPQQTHDYYALVNEDFKKVEQLTKNRSNQLYSVFSEDLTGDEQKYLRFLYAYMPLSDLADNDGKFFLAQVRTALEARAYFSWGKQIPDDIFRHFVLPYRVNNEYPDSARQVFFNELKSRVATLSMYDAALEVNHWCHEKLNYRGTDERTISPLDAMRSTFGRCGEESTFAVTALRSVGIPARQVYTPRWAHCDDNHAWGEVWVDGQWYFMGACEPEAKLNKGWFEAPVLRAMLVHTRVFGRYNSNSNVMMEYSNHAIINVIDTYIEPVEYHIVVTDSSGKPLHQAEVSFGLYNYAEFYPIARLKTDSTGHCCLNTNRGSLLIFAHKNGSSAYAAYRIADNKKSDTLNLSLHYDTNTEYFENIDIIVPEANNVSPDTSGNFANSIRLQFEDSIRKAYAASFPNTSDIENFAKRVGIKTTDISTHIQLSMGNYNEIMQFIEKTSVIDKGLCVDFLNLLNEKDHRDARAAVLINHFNNRPVKKYNNEIYLSYVLNPRIANEKMKAWRSVFGKEFSNSFTDSCRNNPDLIVHFINNTISINNEWNYYGVPITPIGVHEMKIADTKSRNIYFVAICRSMGIASRLNPVTYQPEYYTNGVWNSANFETTTVENATEKAGLTLVASNKSMKYYSDFTLAQYSNGKFTTLDYGWDTPLHDIEMPLQLAPGYYVITTGKRLNNGDVLVWRKYIDLKVGDNKSTEVIVRESGLPKPLGKLNNLEDVKPNIAKDFYMIAWIDTGKEPGKHVLNELSNNKQHIETRNLAIQLLTVNHEKQLFEYYSLPSLCNSVHVSGKPNFDMLQLYQTSSINNLPVIVLCDAKGNIYYYQSGYKVGMVNQMLSIIDQLQ